MGILYYQGVGLPKNYVEAMRWFIKSAVTGNTEAMFNVGVMLRDGLGLPPNYQEALKWFLKADPSDSFATNAIGVLYQEGKGVDLSLIHI